MLPSCLSAGQLSAMNSCQAKAAACSGDAFGAPPGPLGLLMFPVNGGLSSSGTSGDTVIGSASQSAELVESAQIDPATNVAIAGRRPAFLTINDATNVPSLLPNTL